MKYTKAIVIGFMMLISSSCFSQLSMQQMINVKLGSTFKESKPEIKKLFSQQPKIKKSDFLGAYQIVYDNVSFDFYGNADYTFQFIKDTLVAIEVDFQFLSTETYEFKRLYNTLTEDIQKDKSKVPTKGTNNLDYNKILKEVELECEKNSKVLDKDYIPINIKSLGRNYWELYNNSYSTNRFLRLSVSIGELLAAGHVMTGEGKYKGCTINLLLKLSNYDYLDLQSQLNKIRVSYTEMQD